MVAIIQNLQAHEIVILLFLVLLLFGAKRLPEMARSLGRAKREFSEGLKEGQTEEQKAQAEGGPQPNPVPGRQAEQGRNADE